MVSNWFQVVMKSHIQFSTLVEDMLFMTNRNSCLFHELVFSVMFSVSDQLNIDLVKIIILFT